MKLQIAVLTAAYVIAVAILMLWSGDTYSRLYGVVFGEVVFSSPMAAAWLLRPMLKQVMSKWIILIFQITYSIFSGAMITLILMAQHDAQWKLEFIIIPMIGFQILVIAAILAAFWEWRTRTVGR